MPMKRKPILFRSLSSRLSPELRLILACLSHGNSKMASPACEQVSSDIEWKIFLQLAEQHCVGPLILRAFLQEEHSRFPEKVLKSLAMEHKTNVFISMNLSDALCRLAIGFQTAGIRMISLKGPSLAQALFNDTSLRVSSDLDIFVSLDEVDAVEALLQQIGYQSIGRNRVLTDRQKKLFHILHHHRTFVHPETRINLEVHWRLNRLDTGFLTEKHFAKLWQRTNRMLVNDVPVFTLGPADNFLYLCLHGACHQWSRLSWLYDIHELLANWSNLKIEELLSRSKSHRIDDIVGQTLILLELLFGTQYCAAIPPWFDMNRAARLAAMVLPFLETSETAKEATLLSSHMYRIILYTFVLLKTSARRIRYLKGLLMPTDLEIQTLAIPDVLFPLYFLAHPVCTVYRSVAKAAGVKDPFSPSSMEML